VYFCLVCETSIFAYDIKCFVFVVLLFVVCGMNLFFPLIKLYNLELNDTTGCVIYLHNSSLFV